jgi:hypothetical protein
MARDLARKTKRSPLLPAMFVVAVALSSVSAVAAFGQDGTPPPNTFSMRLEGYAVEAHTFSTATAATPRSAYSFAKVNSILDLDGGRGLDMEARGANGQYAGLEGAVLFAGGMPTNGNNLPGYSQAFFPTSDGLFSQISEKCATNQTEAREAPECRDQQGPYALAMVVPDQVRPVVEGIGRNEGGPERGEARSQSLIEPQPDGSVIGIQTNSGSDQAVPGTPIVVESYVAEQTVRSTVGSATTEIRCEGEVTVGGQQVNDNAQLQQALAPLTVGSDLRVTFEPPTEPTIEHLPGGALEAFCRGPRLTVFGGAQGGSGTSYTFGSTFAATGITEDAQLGFGDADTFGGFSSAPAGPPPAPTGAIGAPAGSAGGSSFSPSSSSGGGSSSDPSPSSGPAPELSPSPVEQAPPATGRELASTDLVRRSIDTMPIGLLTGAAAALLPLAVWLLLGVTGSLARGLPSLRLPPFDS